MKRNVCYSVLTVALLSSFSFMLFGCRDSNEPQQETSSTVLPDSLFLDAAPAGVQPISSLKSNAREGDTVVVRAVIGGRSKVFVDNRAVMTVIDAGLDNPCTKEDDHCSTPWDYCCTPSDQLLPQMASVQILDSDHRPLAVDLSKIGNLKPLTTLVIQGSVAPRPDQNSLVINANGIFVESSHH